MIYSICFKPEYLLEGLLGVRLGRIVEEIVRIVKVEQIVIL